MMPQEGRGPEVLDTLTDPLALDEEEVAMAVEVYAADLVGVQAPFYRKPSMTVVLRPYQDALVTDIRAAFAKHRRVVAVAPTGSGKTATFAYIATATAAKGNTVVIVAHRAEIVDQISIALDRMGVRHGRIQPGHSMTLDPVQVAMIQDVLGALLDRVKEPSLLVVDESHHGVARKLADRHGCMGQVQGSRRYRNTPPPGWQGP